jgi:hypothetical protein
MNTTTSQSRVEISKARVIETRHVWAPTIAEAMAKAQSLNIRGWSIEGPPSPMVWGGMFGTGVVITRVMVDE